MKFKRGQEVEVFRNLGPEGGHDQDSYYYNGNINHVALGSPAKVKRIIRDDQVLIRLADGRRWYAHPNELSLKGKSLDSRQFMQEKLSQPLFDLADESTIFLLDEKAYAAVNGEAAEGQDFLQKNGWFRQRRWPVVGLGSFETLDDLCINRAGESLRKAQSGYVRKVIESLSIFSDLDGFCASLDIPQLIYKQVFPHLRSKRKKFASLLGIGEEDDAPDDESLDALRKEYGGLARKGLVEVEKLIKGLESSAKAPKEKLLDEIFGVDEVETGGTFLGHALEGRNLALCGHKVYSLTDDTGCRFNVSIGGRTLGLHREGSISGLRRSYNQGRELELKLHALRHHVTGDGILDVLNDQKAMFDAVKGLQDYSEEDFGFVRNNGYYYAYIVVPDFAIRSQFDGNCYLFKEARLGIRVQRRGTRLSYTNNLFLIDNNNHPFLHNETGMYQELCMGYLKFPTSGESIGDIVAKRLRRGKEMLMFGYTGYKYKECYELRRRCKKCESGHFEQNIVSGNELEERGIPIIQGGKRR